MSTEFLKQGKVKFYKKRNGYGFIIDSETNNEYFFHFSNVVEQKELKENDEVFFEIKKNKRGEYASDIYVKTTK
jgi:CspA family cold shock protein